MKNSVLKYIPQKLYILHLAIFQFFLWFSTDALAQLPQEERKTPPMAVQPQEQMQLAVSYEDEIEKNELPERIQKSIDETYPDYKILKLYRGSDGSYKTRLEKGDEKIALFYNSDGEFLRLEDDKSEDTINDDWR